MPTSGKNRQPKKKSAASKKGAAKTSSAAAGIRGGPLPPYGIAIREAVARGDAREMKALATATRQYLKNVQSALDKLEKAIS